MKVKNDLLGKPLNNESVVSRIVNRITDAIIANELKPGDKLPTETELSETFKVGRNSVREAIKTLEAYGVLYIKRADGTYVNDCYTQKMLDPLLYGIILQKNFGHDIIQLRKVLDIGVIHVAAANATKEQIMEMEKAYEKLSKSITCAKPKYQKVVEADLAFHTSINSMVNNPLLLDMCSYVDRITIPSRKRATEQIFLANNTENFLMLHRKLVDIIRTKNLSAAEQTVNEHYIYWQDEMNTTGNPNEKAVDDVKEEIENED